MGYGIAYFSSSKLKQDFIRFGLAKAGALTAILEIMGALGLLFGLKFRCILLVSSAGLALLMVLGVAVRLKARDSIWLMLPAMFFMVLNAYIFFMSLKT